jgi:hypothetical protein
LTTKQKTTQKHASKKNAVLPPSKSQKIKSQSLKIVKAALDKLHKLNKEKYDGVKGVLPDWMPDPLKFEFNSTRDTLLDNYTHKNILKYLNAKKFINKESPHWSSCPPEIEDKIDVLFYIYQLSKLGKKDGIQAYLGKSSTEVYRGIALNQKNKEISKRPRTDALNKLIIEMLASQHNLGTSGILKKLKSLEGKGVIEKILEDSEEKVIIEWTSKNGKAKETSLIQLQNRISRIKNKLLSLTG